MIPSPPPPPTLELDGAPFTVNRIFCIGANYADHLREMGEVDEDRCVIFAKPPSALVPVGQTVSLPADRGAVHHEVELVLALGRGGHDLDPDAAAACIAGASLGLDLTLRDLQSELKRRGHPWERCKAFDHSAPIGTFTAAADLDLDSIAMTCRVDGDLRQDGNTCNMLLPAARLVAVLSRIWHLQPGDLLFTGTPAGVGLLSPGQPIEIASPQLGCFAWETCAV